ncbi:MAG: hypothetical protein WA663_09605 [Candidatus Acidiferrales bacterium]
MKTKRYDKRREEAMEEAREAMKEESMQEKLQPQHFIRWGLAIFGAAILFLLPAGRASAQSGTAGPMPAATSSDQTAPASQPTGQPVAQAAGARPNLAGTWALNKDQSDDPRQKMREAMAGGEGGQGEGHGGWGGGGNGGGGGGWGGGGNGGGGGYGGGGYGGNGGGRGRGQGEGMLNELSQLTIEQTNTSAKVTGSSGRVLALYSASSAATPASTQGGSSTSSSSSGGEDDYAPPAAQWQGSQLVAVAERHGGTNTQTYELSPDGKQLFVTTKMESERFTQPVVFRLVYDPVKSSGGSSQ